MSVNFVPDKTPKRTHIMIGLESSSYLVSGFAFARYTFTTVLTV